MEKIGAHVARYNITLLAHLSLHSRPSFICKTIVAALLWRIVGSRASGPVYHTSFISRHLLPALSPFFVFFLILLPPSSLHPYLISPIGLLNRWCSATPPLPPFLPLSSASSFISSTSVFGSEPRLVPFQRHADKWISLLIKSFTRPRSFLSSSPPPV